MRKEKIGEPIDNSYMPHHVLDDEIASTNDVRVPAHGHAHANDTRDIAWSDDTACQFRAHVDHDRIAVQALYDMFRIRKRIEEVYVAGGEEISTLAPESRVRNFVNDENDVLRRKRCSSFVTQPSEPDFGTFSPTRLDLDVYQWM